MNGPKHDGLEYVLDCIGIAGNTIGFAIATVVLSPIWVPLFLVGAVIKHFQDRALTRGGHDE